MPSSVKDPEHFGTNPDVSLTIRSGSGSCYFRHWPSRRQHPKENYFIQVFLLFEAIFTPFFKDKKSRRSHKTIGIKVFLLFLLYNRKIRKWSRRVPLTNGSRSRRLKTYGFYGSRSATLVPRVKLFSWYCSFLYFYFVHEVMHKYALTLRCSLLSHNCDLHSVQIMFNYFQVNQQRYLYFICTFSVRISRCLQVHYFSLLIFYFVSIFVKNHIFDEIGTSTLFTLQIIFLYYAGIIGCDYPFICPTFF